MASVSSVSSASQYGFAQLRLQQARRDAEQAETTAQALKAQANQAQREAVSANENARNLSVQASQAQENAGQARQGLAAMSTAQQSITQLSNTVDQVQARQTAPETATPSTRTSVASNAAASISAPVTNTQGQVTGKIINTTA